MPDGTVVNDARRRGARRPGRRRHRAASSPQGGRGGLGNAALASPERKAPGFALLGEPGDELDVVLELKVVADVGLVGFPQRRQVQPDRGDVARPGRRSPTTRSPRWCPTSAWSRAGDTTFTVADVPGLIEGASEGKGLGHDFLRHVERCAALVHVLDMRHPRARPRPGRATSTCIEHELRDVRRPRGPAAAGRR